LWASAKEKQNNEKNMDRTNKRIFNKSAERDEDKKVRRIMQRKGKRNDEEKKKNCMVIVYRPMSSTRDENVYYVDD
jgi:hypothetical protein